MSCPPSLASWRNCAPRRGELRRYRIVRKVRHLSPYPSQDTTGCPSKSPAAAPIPAKTVRRVLAVLKSGFNYVIVDTLSSLDDMTLAALIHSNQIILILVPEVASVQAATVTLQAFRSLGLSEEAVVPIVNHTFAKGGLSLGTIQSALKRPIKAVIPHEPELLIQAINSGTPLVLSQPSSAMATAIQKLASVLSPS